MRAKEIINSYYDGLLSRGDAVACLVRAIEAPAEVSAVLDAVPTEIWDLFVKEVASIGDGTGLVSISRPPAPLRMDVIAEIRKELRSRGVAETAHDACE